MTFTNCQKRIIRKSMLEKLGLKGCEKFDIFEVTEDIATGLPIAELTIRSKHIDYKYRMTPLGEDAEYRIVGPLNSSRCCGDKERFLTDSPLYLKAHLRLTAMMGEWTD